MDKQAKRKRPTYSDEFKRDLVRLVVEEGYSIRAATRQDIVQHVPRRPHRLTVDGPVDMAFRKLTEIPRANGLLALGEFTDETVRLLLELIVAGAGVHR